MEKLALLGGAPVRETNLPYGHQTIDDDDVQAVVKALKSEYLTTGPKVLEFEEKVKEYVGAKYAVAVSNGTAALHIACLAAGIKEGDEVIVTPMTFAASANCILYCGAKPIFCDIEEDTGNIKVDLIEKKINKRTRAIIGVDFTGHPVDIDKINKICKKHNLIFIEDGAHSLGSKYKGQKVGNKADFTTFSFHPVKPITTGEGGMVTTNSKEFYEKLLLFRSHGITRSKELMINDNGPWYYEQLELGYNYRITDINCALGLSQFNKIDRFIGKRREIVKLYNKLLKDVEEVEIPVEKDYSESGYHIYVIKLNLEKLNADRRDIFEAMRAENIGVNVHYIPVYEHPYYKNIGYGEVKLENTKKFYERIITMPLFPSMNEKDVLDAVNALKKVIGYYKKQ